MFSKNILKRNCLNKTLFILIFLLSCARAGEYAGVNHGYVTVGLKQRFGSGADKKKYHLTKEGAELIPGASKEIVRREIGAPDKIQSNNEGYEVWIYNERKLKLYFDKERLSEWNRI